jgi:hypothetical protein
MSARAEPAGEIETPFEEEEEEGGGGGGAVAMAY